MFSRLCPSMQTLLIGAARCLFLLFCAQVTVAAEQTAGQQPLQESGALTVTLSGMKSDDGSLVYAIWSGPEGWLETNNVGEGSVPVIDGRSEIHFESLPYGEYAISVYHDLNDNKKIDTGLFKIPKEPLGTSNDAKIRFGPPRYEDAAFILDQPELTIHIPVRKLFSQ